MLDRLEREAAIRHIISTIGTPCVNDAVVASFLQSMRQNRNYAIVDALCECIRELSKRSKLQTDAAFAAAQNQTCNSNPLEDIREATRRAKESTVWTPATDIAFRRSLLEAARRINESTNSMLPKKHRDFFVDTLADAMTDMPPQPKPEAANELDGMPMPEFIDKCL